MDTVIRRLVHAEPAIVFELAAAVEDWPRLLPHYDWVRVLASHGASQRTVAMAARRDVVPGLGFPLRWTAVQTLFAQECRVEFEHVRGMTRGMHVAWTMDRVDDSDGLLVTIRHVFEPRWPVPEALVRAIVGDYFVNGVARRTLQRLGELAEARTASTAALKR